MLYCALHSNSIGVNQLVTIVQPSVCDSFSGVERDCSTSSTVIGARSATACFSRACDEMYVSCFSWKSKSRISSSFSSSSSFLLEACPGDCAGEVDDIWSSNEVIMRLSL